MNWMDHLLPAVIFISLALWIGTVEIRLLIARKEIEGYRERFRKLDDGRRDGQAAT
ncbi:TPA: hypothetical protein UMT89_004276 [Stenotrophomonas maltophilia]|nr:hypothetical protein [Stenotrophomonas maltophilia]HEL3812876.1 hypothetical protein [Stenotrophomonas maltophilia]